MYVGGLIDTMITLDLRLEYPDEATARSILAALSPDNEGYLESTIDGNVITFTIVADRSGTVRNSADDLMACIKVAEDVVGFTHKP